MKINYLRFSTLPSSVRSFCFLSNGWIVGGGARYLLGIEHTKPRDWDILIPLENWDKTCKVFPKGSLTNSFGGIKLKFEDAEIDVWGDSLSNFIQTQNQHPNYAVNLNGFHSLVFNNEVKYTNENP